MKQFNFGILWVTIALLSIGCESKTPPAAGGGAGANAKTTANGNGAKTKSTTGANGTEEKIPSPKKTAHEQAVGYWVFDAQLTANTLSFKAVSVKSTGPAEIVNQFKGVWLNIDKTKIDTGHGNEGASDAYTVLESTDTSITILTGPADRRQTSKFELLNDNSIAMTILDPADEALPFPFVFKRSKQPATTGSGADKTPAKSKTP